MPSAERRRVLCVDFGSTFTKASLVDLETARVVAAAEHRTTIDTDVLDGLDACLAAMGDPDAPVLACSSAGGGLRIAVVGNEELVTAEAGRRVALSSGGKVVAVVAAAAGFGALHEPDVVLLTGGTDGGNSEVIVAAARDLVAAGWRGPVVVAGNGDATDEVAAVLGDVPHVVAANVVPQIGVLRPEGARAAIREAFLSHVIGGKHLSARADFVAMVRGATPDVVLTGVEILAEVAGDVVVVDVGGATTDVHSVVDLDPEDGALARDVVAPTGLTRTVEGDLGMRWSALTTVEEAGLPASRAPRPPGPTTRRTCPPPTPTATTTRPSPAPPSAWHCAATPGARGSWSAPAAGSPNAPAPTCARSTSWSPPAACCGTAGPVWPSACSPARWAPVSTAAGSCPSIRGWSWTPTTCSPRSGSSPPTTPRWPSVSPRP